MHGTAIWAIWLFEFVASLIYTQFNARCAAVHIPLKYSVYSKTFKAGERQ